MSVKRFWVFGIGVVFLAFWAWLATVMLSEPEPQGRIPGAPTGFVVEKR